PSISSTRSSVVRTPASIIRSYSSRVHRRSCTLTIRILLQRIAAEARRDESAFSEVDRTDQCQEAKNAQHQLRIDLSGNPAQALSRPNHSCVTLSASALLRHQ